MNGSADSALYATSAGVVWSFTPGKVGQVARSTDGGRTWQVVLPGPGPHPNLALSASFFLGPDHGWVIHQYQRGVGSARGPRQLMTVMGTSDGGRHWWSSPPLPAHITYQPDFTDAQHGWLFGMQWVIQGDMVWQAEEQLLRTSDGGHTWTRVRARLPLRGTTDQDDEICPDEGPFHVAFASQQNGWLTASTCTTIGIAPRVWRTTDGGVTWTAARLPAPPGGWPTASDIYSGVSVGTVWIAGSALLVAVRTQSGLDIETSTDGGRRWHLAGQVQAGYFEPIDARHWVVYAPGEVASTSDAGRRWQLVRTTSAPKSGPFWFTSAGQGYARGPAGVTVATRDGGRTWSARSTLPTARPAPGPAVTAVQKVTPALAVAWGPDTLRVSRNGGRTWAPLPPVPGRHPLGVVQFMNPSTWFAVDQSGRQLWRTADGGSTWTPLRVPQGVRFDHVQFDHVQFWTTADGAAVSVVDGVFVTRNGGQTWQPSKLPAGYQYNLFDRIGGYEHLGHDGYPRYQYACFSGGTGWLVTYPPHAPEHQDVLVSTDGGAHWRPVISPAILASTGQANLSAWLGACRGPQAWVQVVQQSYAPGGHGSYDLLHTADTGRTWLDVLHVQNGAAVPRLKPPLSPGAVTALPLPAGPALIPEPVVLTSVSGAWLTFVTTRGSIAFAVTSDAGRHWLWHWFPHPKHAPRTAPASPSGLPAGLPWLDTTATDTRHAWVLLGSTNGSGDSYLYATSDGGATWTRIATFSAGNAGS